MSSLGEHIRRKASWEIFAALVHPITKIFKEDDLSLGPMHKLLVKAGGSLN